MKIFTLFFALLLFVSCYGDSDAVTTIPGTSPQSKTSNAAFAAQVVEFHPAPGQFANNPSYSNPIRALGEPDGSIVSLGSFGGSITLRFPTPIIDKPGIADFIIFGNALYDSSSRKRWAEPGIIEISEDGTNWFLIGGSIFSNEYQPLTNITSIIYTNSNSSIWPAWATDSNQITLSAYDITRPFSSRLENGGMLWYTNSASESGESLYGFADCTPWSAINFSSTGWQTDNPLQFGNEGCGGDTIMLEWAVDVNGNSIYTTISNRSFYYVRITTAVNMQLGILGENSPEIDAVGIIQ